MSDYEIPEDLRYSEEDEWARREDDQIVVGITDYAQQQLGDIVFVELPEIGVSVRRGETFGVIESVKAVSDLYAPVSGEVTVVNDILEERPEAVNAACYGDGWIIAVSPSEPSEFEELLDPAAYGKYVDERSE